MPRIKYVEWNADYSMIALISKHQIVLANKQLEQLSAATEVKHFNFLFIYLYSGMNRR